MLLLVPTGMTEGILRETTRELETILSRSANSCNSSPPVFVINEMQREKSHNAEHTDLRVESQHMASVTVTITTRWREQKDAKTAQTLYEL